LESAYTTSASQRVSNADARIPSPCAALRSIARLLTIIVANDLHRLHADGR
jgi:hypothetical protein